MFFLSKNIKMVFAIFAFSLTIILAGCGDYKPCEVLAYRICTECPKVADHWQAACMCIENGTTKENGYKCIDAEEEDNIRCHANLLNWDEGLSSCEQLN